jgi:hypothetical protein
MGHDSSLIRLGGRGQRHGALPSYENRIKSAKSTGNIRKAQPQYIVGTQNINTLPCYFSLYKSPHVCYKLFEKSVKKSNSTGVYEEAYAA